MRRREIMPLMLAGSLLGTGTGPSLAQTPATNGGKAAPAPTAASGATPTPLFPEDEEFWYEAVRMFGTDEYGAGSFGEILATCNVIKVSDYDSWYDGWNGIADRIAAEGDSQLAKKHRISARDSYLRASSYYRSSEFFLHANPKDPRVTRAYQRSIATYKAAAALYDLPIQPVEIPYEKTTLPGYLHRVDDKVRPLLIMHTGYDGSAEENHWSGARAAVERGYHVLSFDGPGQFGPLHREGLTFRPDWEKVVTPVLDYALTLPGIDAKRVALRGDSFGGYLAPRAAAFEHRLAALIANDGVYNFAAPYVAPVPEPRRSLMVAALKKGPVPQVDALMKKAMQQSPVARWSFTHGVWAFGASSLSDFLGKALDYTLADGMAEKIQCPTLVCNAEGDLFFQGQAQELYDHLTCPKTYMNFTNAEGAGAHCEVGACRLSSARMFDWLDETLEV